MRDHLGPDGGTTERHPAYRLDSRANGSRAYRSHRFEGSTTSAVATAAQVASTNQAPVVVQGQAVPGCWPSSTPATECTSSSSRTRAAWCASRAEPACRHLVNVRVVAGCSSSRPDVATPGDATWQVPRPRALVGLGGVRKTNLATASLRLSAATTGRRPESPQEFPRRRRWSSCRDRRRSPGSPRPHRPYRGSQRAFATRLVTLSDSPCSAVRPSAYSAVWRIEDRAARTAEESVGRHRYGSVAAPPEGAFALVALPAVCQWLPRAVTRYPARRQPSRLSRRFVSGQHP